MSKANALNVMGLVVSPLVAWLGLFALFSVDGSLIYGLTEASPAVRATEFMKAVAGAVLLIGALGLCAFCGAHVTTAENWKREDGDK